MFKLKNVLVMGKSNNGHGQENGLNWDKPSNNPIIHNFISKNEVNELDKQIF